MKDIGIWNPRIRTIGIRNPDGWNPESRGLESGIQEPCGFCYMGRKIGAEFTATGFHQHENWQDLEAQREKTKHCQPTMHCLFF